MKAGDGVFLHVVTDGRADATVSVVLAHGFAARLQMFDSQRAALRDRAGLVLFDQRGHGASAWGGRSSANMERLGRDLGEVIDQRTGSRPVVVVGHSMGGMALMALAEQRPELFGAKIVGIALVSTSGGRLAETRLPPPVARILMRTGIARACLWAAWLVAQLIDRLAPDARPEERTGLRKRVFDRVVPADLAAEMENLWAYTSRSIGSAFYPALLYHDGSRGMAALKSVPALVVAGTSDVAIPAAHSERLAEALGPATRLVLVPGGGHMVNMTHPRRVNQSLLDLLARAEGARPRDDQVICDACDPAVARTPTT